MRIGIDYIATIGKGGNSAYSKNLIKEMVDIDHTNQYYFYGYIHDFLLGRFGSQRSGNVHWRPVFISPLGLPIPEAMIQAFNSVAVRFWSLIDQLDIFHFTNPLYFIRGLKKSIVTVHDLSSFHNKGWTKEHSAALLSKNMKDILGPSFRIIAVSEYTKQDIVKRFGTDPSKINVVYEGADTAKYYPDFDPRYLKNKFDLTSYFLYVGQLQPRKNIINIIAGYARLSPELKQKYPLVFVGNARDKRYSEKIAEIIEHHQLGSHVKILGRLDDDSVRKLYSGARVFVFPSLFEGFGLPVLESLQCGTPVITSNTTSLPEVAGDAGILVDPENVDAIARAMQTMTTDDDFYDNLKKRCLNQASKFSWNKAARETIKIYEQIHTSDDKRKNRIFP